MLNRLFVFVALSAVACGDGPAAPTPQPTPVPIPTCQSNQTATVTFGNRSNSTYTVVFDGATVATLGPGQDSPRQVVAANVAHTLDFFISNTNRRACTTSMPVYTICADRITTCSSD